MSKRGTQMSADDQRSVGKPSVSAAVSDTDLVQQCLAGKEAAWFTLIDKYKNLIYSIPVKYGLSQEDCADIFQSVCVELLAHLPKIREPKALAGWLIQVTSHQCFRLRREQERSSNDVDSELSGSIAATPGNLLVELEQEQLLREAVATLSPRCRQLVHQLFFEQPPRPYDQVAQSLGLATGSIGFIRGRCLEKLRAFLNKAGFSAG
jgi:RNA polymerase sigma factor (sigma-70 family)